MNCVVTDAWFLKGNLGDLAMNKGEEERKSRRGKDGKRKVLQL